MCGLAGAMPMERGSETVLAGMIAAIRHRGPDGQGLWVDPERAVGLAHARLSIQDVSSAGIQPMTSAAGRYDLVFNGEIYNHPALRQELTRSGLAPAQGWRSGTDSETLLAAIDAWGMSDTLPRLQGMFAFVVWDRQCRTLTLVRDRVGEKPLYYAWMGGPFLFGSELPALRAHPAFRADIDRQAVTALLRLNHIPAPWTIYRGVRKLLPGTMLTVRPGDTVAEPVPYWSAQRVVDAGQMDPWRGSPEAAVDALGTLLDEVVRGQMRADVPVGAFLSGGIDSTVVAALMQRQAAAPVPTFAVGFDVPAFNEADHAAAVARHLGTNHTTLMVTAADALEMIPRLATIYSEPFADASQLPTALVALLARRSVTVALAGDGGDELFGGYNRYWQGIRLAALLQAVPQPVREVVASAIGRVSASAWDRVLGRLARRATGWGPQVRVGDQLLKGAALLTARTTTELYRGLLSAWQHPAALVQEGEEPLTIFTDPARQVRTDSVPHDLMAMDLVSYLPDDNLVKLDRAAMAASLETRAPLLDHRVVEFAWRLPLALKRRDGETKWPLRQLAYRHVPRALLDRPKMGFSVPVAEWLRGPLRDWAEAQLSEERLAREGLLDARLVRRAWDEHQSGTRNWQQKLWIVLMLQGWLDAQRR
jgi:asparagine synthase (glutamine-hydrolysing)